MQRWVLTCLGSVGLSESIVVAAVQGASLRIVVAVSGMQDSSQGFRTMGSDSLRDEVVLECLFFCEIGSIYTPSDRILCVLPV